MAFTFKGGIHPDPRKNTRKTPVVQITPPASVHIPMSMHIGVPCTPCVKVGDIVDKGQVIGTIPEDRLGCPVHASISGKVTAIEERCTGKDGAVCTVTIENDYQNRIAPGVAPFEGDARNLTSEQIVKVVRAAGIVGMGGAAFPTYAKIEGAIGRVKGMIVNGAECEPYITANHRLLLEQPERVVGGIKILLKALSLRSAVLAVEANKIDAVKAVAALDFDPEMIRICVMKTKYPQGDERRLIHALTGKEIPAGKLPTDIGYVVFNVETCAAVYDAFVTGMPSVERIVTVDGGCVQSPANLLVPIGTPVRDLLSYCDTDVDRIGKLIAGGPMMGRALCLDDTPVTKGTSAILAFEKREALKQQKTTACIRCGRCLSACPSRLMPREIYRAFLKGDTEKCSELSAPLCVECGSCSYVCPAKLDLTQAVSGAKARLKAIKRTNVPPPKQKQIEQTKNICSPEKS